jgi:hypothetical protein
MRKIVHPISCILLMFSIPVHNTFSFFLIIHPRAFILILRGIDHFPLSVLFILLKLTFIVGSICIVNPPFPTIQSMVPFPDILTTICIGVKPPVALPIPILNFTLIEASIRPLEPSLPFDLILIKISIINESTLPNKPTLPIKQPILYHPFILVTIGQINGCIPFQAFIVHIGLRIAKLNFTIPLLVEGSGQVKWHKEVGFAFDDAGLHVRCFSIDILNYFPYYLSFYQ